MENDTRYYDGKLVYCPIYEFYFNGKQYKVMNNNYTNIYVKPAGTLVNLKINPNNPREFFNEGVTSIPTVILGIVFLIVSVPVFLMIIANATFIIK